MATGILKTRLESVELPRPAEPAGQGRIADFGAFGDNPGRLRMLAHVPSGLGAHRPVVVLLHGCSQDAATFAVDSGWTALADRIGFPLVLPQQAEANNANRCFKWFHAEDIRRDRGEAGSIAAMTRAALHRFAADGRRVFIVGLSAGAAMAAAVLAAYPDVFAAGAAVAGLPVGVAHSPMQALMRMASAGTDQPPELWAQRVRAAAPAGFAGPWPRLSIWQGRSDTTVAPDNASLLARQWQALLGLAPQDGVDRMTGEVSQRVWPRNGRPMLELWSVAHLAHAYPIGRRAAAPGRFVASAPVDATAGAAGFFGLD